jgi:polar amino acid transport system substrate-binding protein
MRRPSRVLAIVALSSLVVACTSSGASPSAAPGTASAAPSVEASPSAAPSASPSPDACAKGSLTLVTPGTFTIGTDNPAYPPYFLENDGGAKTAPWELGDPTNGNGFESAVGYAIADALGFAKTEVTWVVVPFNNSFAPGPKTFDIDLNQVSYKTERAQTADLSDGYYFGNQSLVALKSNPVAKVTSVSGLKDFAFGAQVGTTSYDAITSLIAPTKDAQVFDSNDAAIEAVKNGTIDGVVVDLPTADFITNVQLEKSVIVGQFDGGTPEYFSAVLSKDSPLTDCVNTAIGSLSGDGTLDVLASQWLPFQDAVPVFQP